MSSWGRKRKGREKDRKKRKKKERKGGPTSTGPQCSNNKRFDGSESELIWAPRDRSYLMLWLFSI